MPFTSKGFEVMLASPPEYEKLTAEIFFDGKFVALMSQESGFDKMDLETPGADLDETLICRKFNLSEFLSAVDIARRRLRGGK